MSQFPPDKYYSLKEKDVVMNKSNKYSESELRLLDKLNELFPDEELMQTEWDTDFPRIMALISSYTEQRIEEAFKAGVGIKGGDTESKDRLYRQWQLRQPTNPNVEKG